MQENTDKKKLHIWTLFTQLSFNIAFSIWMTVPFTYEHFAVVTQLTLDILSAISDQFRIMTCLRQV